MMTSFEETQKYVCGKLDRRTTEWLSFFATFAKGELKRLLNDNLIPLNLVALVQSAIQAKIYKIYEYKSEEELVRWVNFRSGTPFSWRWRFCWDFGEVLDRINNPEVRMIGRSIPSGSSSVK